MNFVSVFRKTYAFSKREHRTAVTTWLAPVYVACLIGLAARPGLAQQPDSDYVNAVAAIARRQAIDDRVAAPGARSLLLTNGARTPRVVVLLHGLTDSPLQFQPLAELLHADGSNVYVPRLPDHGLRGGSVRTLSALTADELRGVADSVVREASGLGDSVIVVGLSMGATVGAWIAQHRIVTRVVLIAPAIEPGRVPRLLDRPLIGLADHLPSIVRPSLADTTRPDREAGFDSHAVAQVLGLGRAVQFDAEREAPLTLQITVLVNAADRTVRESAAEALAHAWAAHGVMVSVFELPDSLRLKHNIVDPIEGRTLVARVLAVVRELAYGDAPDNLVRRLPDY